MGGPRVDRIRHVIKPEVTYLYVPNVYQGDLPDYVPLIEEENGITYGMTHVFTARLADEEGKVSYREFLRMKISQTYDILEARRGLEPAGPERRPFGVIDLECDGNPFRYLSLEADARFDVNDGEWKEVNAGFDMEDWRGDTGTIEYRYTQDSVEELNLRFKGRVSDRVDLSYVLRRNILDKQYLETTYGLDYHRQCWSVNASYTDSSDDRSFMLVFSLYGLGKVGKISGGFPE